MLVCEFVRLLLRASFINRVVSQLVSGVPLKPIARGFHSDATLIFKFTDGTTPRLHRRAPIL